jgi:molybdenum cofactor cytidylyltransferase
MSNKKAKIAAIILAAGESKRMGQLKPLIRTNGRTFLQRIVDTLHSCDLDEIIVVLGHEAENIKKESPCEARFVINENFHYGQLSSLQKGVAALSQETDAVLVCLGDQPQIKIDWIKTLISSFNKTKAAITIPVYQGRGGHPVIYGSQLFAEILRMPPSQTAKHLIRKYGHAVERITIDDPDILLDADTPDDLEKILQHLHF